VFIGSTSLTILGELNHIIVTFHHIFTLVDWLSWVNVRGRCYIVVLEHGSTIGLDGQNVVIMRACRVYMCFLCMHGDDNC